MGKWEDNKKMKRLSLLDTGFNLITTRGLEKTSISDIAGEAGVAKGTFYLYFKDKYDLRNKLIAHKASQLFQNAAAALGDQKLPFEDKMLFIIDNIIDQLNENRSLLNLISKNLSWAIFKNALTQEPAENDTNFKQLYYQLISESELEIQDPEVMLFLIIELVSSTSYSAILYGDPVSVEGLKPFLNRTIRSIIQSHLEPIA